MLLPEFIEKVVVSTAANVIPNDTVLSELSSLAQEKNGSFAMALYMLGFGRYKGF